MPDHPAAPGPSRRLVLRGALSLPATVLAAGLSGCGPVRLGQPATYSPPPPGIDDLYRPDVQTALAAVEKIITGTRAPEPLQELVVHLRSALPLQQDALLTGAEQEKADAGGSSSASGTGSATEGGAAPDGAMIDASSLVGALEAVRDLTADACIQCSGSLARVLAAIGAHHTWAAGRAAILLGDPAVAVAPTPAADSLVPTREVPESDPPSVGAREDYQTYLESTQSDEWYAGYVDEVLAARAGDGGAREALLASSAAHRDLADQLTGIAQEDGLAAVAEEPVYPLPSGGADPRAMQMLPERIGHALVVDWVSMVGAVPFERRAISVAAALAAASTQSRLSGTLSPLPSLTLPKKR